MTDGRAYETSFWQIFTLKSSMLTSCRDDAHARWKLLRDAGDAPKEGGSRALLAWAKQNQRVDQAELDRFVKRVVTLFTEGYVGVGGTVRVSLEQMPSAETIFRDGLDWVSREYSSGICSYV